MEHTAAKLNLQTLVRISRKSCKTTTKWRGVDPDAKNKAVSQLRDTFNKLSGEWAGLPNLKMSVHTKDIMVTPLWHLIAYVSTLKKLQDIR